MSNQEKNIQAAKKYSMPTIPKLSLDQIASENQKLPFYFDDKQISHHTIASKRM